MIIFVFKHTTKLLNIMIKNVTEKELRNVRSINSTEKTEIINYIKKVLKQTSINKKEWFKVRDLFPDTWEKELHILYYKRFNKYSNIEKARNQAAKDLGIIFKRVIHEENPSEVDYEMRSGYLTEYRKIK